MKKKILGLFSCVLSLAVLVSCFGSKQAPTTTTTQTPVTTASDQTTTPAPVTTTTTAEPTTTTVEPSTSTTTDEPAVSTTTDPVVNTTPAHTHSTDKVNGRAATATEAGYKDYYLCAGCAKYYEDAAATIEIADLQAWKAKGGNGYIAPTGTQYQEDDHNINVARALEIANALAAPTANKSGTSAEGVYTITGVISGGIEAFSSEYGNATFNLNDGGSTSNIIAFRLYDGESKAKFTSTSFAEKIKVGNTVEIVGTIKKWKDGSGNIKLELADGYVKSSTAGSSTQPDNPQPETPTKTEITVAEALTIAKGLSTNVKTETVYTITGVISGNIEPLEEHYNATFDMNDGSGESITVFRSKNGSSKEDWDEDSFDEAIVVGNTVTVVGVLQKFNNSKKTTYEICDCYVVYEKAPEAPAEPADTALDTAFKALNTENYSIKYSYTVSGYFDNEGAEFTYEVNGKNIKLTIGSGNDAVSSYYYENGETKYIVALKSTFDSLYSSSEEEYDWGDYGDDDSYYSYRVKRILKAAAETEDDEYVYMDSSNTDFETVRANLGLFPFDFTVFDYNDFEKVGDVYRAKADKVNDICKDFIGDLDNQFENEYMGYAYVETDTEVFTKLEITLNNDAVSVFTAKSSTKAVEDYGKDEDGEDAIYTYEGKRNYTLSLLAQGNVSFTIPETTTEYEVPEDPYYSDDSTSVADVYSMNDGDSIELQLWVNGVNTTEKVIYACDSYAAIAIHYDNVTLSETPKIGGTIIVTGTVKVTGKLYELVATAVDVDNSQPEQMMNMSVTSLKAKDETFNGETVDFNYLTLKTKDIENSSVVFTTYDGQDIALIFEASEATNVTTLLANVEVGKAVLFNGLAMSYDSEDKFIVRLLDSSSVELANGTICSSTEFEAAVGSDIETAITNLKVFSYVDGVKSELPSTDYNYQSEEDWASIKDKIGSYLVTVTIGSGDEAIKTVVTIRLVAEGEVEAFTETSGKGIEYASKKYGVSVGLPSTGNVNVLVIPVEFTDAKFESNYKETLTLGFNGTSEETGWESLSSYYKKVSGGKLNITATVLDKYETGDDHYYVPSTGNKGNYPEDYMGNYYALDHKYLEDAIKHYDSTINYADYDANNDGNIDCVYLVYSCSTTPSEYSQNQNALEMWWAYTSQFYPATEEKNQYDTKEIDFYMWFSIDFFSEEISNNGQKIDLTVNAETVIHETGHALGLDDYYDTSYSGTGGFGGGAMMDWNVGDHDPYSKALLGWIEPTIVINKGGEFELSSFESSGNAIFIAKDYDGVYFNEYYIIDYYTPTGVNEMEACDGEYGKGLPAQAGVRIIHVNAKPYSDPDNIIYIFGVTEASNSDPNNMLITMVSSDPNTKLGQTDAQGHTVGSQSSDLWQAGQSTSTLKWADGTACDFTISVTSIENGKATVSVTFAE